MLQLQYKESSPVAPCAATSAVHDAEDALRRVRLWEQTQRCAAFWSAAICRATLWMRLVWIEQCATQLQLLTMCDDCLSIVAARAPVAIPLAGTCKRLRPLLLPRLEELHNSAMLNLSLLGHRRERPSHLRFSAALASCMRQVGSSS